MKFIINRDILLSPLQHIVAVIEKRQTMPVLANVLLQIKPDGLVLTGTDLEIQLVAKINASSDFSENITIPARKLLDICRLLPANVEMTFELLQDKIKISSARSRFVLSCLPASSYPEFTESGMDKSFNIAGSFLKKALEKTIFCMANQDVRYYLNGLLLHISNSKIKFVASDGHRLSIFETSLEQPTDYEVKIILPRKGAIELHRLLTEADNQLTVVFSNNNVKIIINELSFSAKLVDAKYPDFSKVFQQSFFKPITVAKQILKDSLTRVAVLSNEKFKGVTLDFSANNLKISTHNPEHDEAEDELTIDYEAEALSIAFNAQYLLDAVSNIDTDGVILTISNNASSCFIEPSETADYKFIVMPMRL